MLAIAMPANAAAGSAPKMAAASKQRVGIAVVAASVVA
jgi:hypothetical protein